MAFSFTPPNMQRSQSQDAAIAMKYAEKNPTTDRAFSLPKPHLRLNTTINSKSHTPFYGGLINSHVPGRTDKLNIAVPHQSYIIPADVVSSLGQGNTMAGAAKLNGMFGMPSATGVAPKMKKFARGGLVPIIVAGGEYHVMPEQVMKLGNGDFKEGSRQLDKLVADTRAKNKKEVADLKPPKK